MRTAEQAVSDALESLLQIRIGSDSLRLIDAAAARKGMQRSTFVRHTLIEAAARILREPSILDLLRQAVVSSADGI